MSQYAKDTTVSVEKSKAEIERTLMRYGANGFYSGWQEVPPASAIGFQLGGRTMRIEMPMPAQSDFARDGRNKLRSKEARFKAWEQAQRQRWRALALIVKAKLEFIECGLSTVEKEFLADVLMPDGQRLGDAIRDQIATAYETGRMPPLLPAPRGEDRDV